MKKIIQTLNNQACSLIGSVSLEDFSSLKEGTDCKVYLLKKKWILKIWPATKPLYEIQYENFILEKMKFLNFYTQNPYIWYTQTNFHTLAITQFIPGKLLTSPTFQEIIFFTDFIAQLHQVSFNTSIHISPNRLLLNDINFLESPYTSLLQEEIKNFLKRTKEIINWELLSTSLIHDDISSSNTVVQNKKLYIIDWSDAHIDYSIADLACIIVQFRLKNNIVKKIYNRYFLKTKTEVSLIALKFACVRRAAFLSFYFLTKTTDKRKTSSMFYKLSKLWAENAYQELSRQFSI